MCSTKLTLLPCDDKLISDTSCLTSPWYQSTVTPMVYHKLKEIPASQWIFFILARGYFLEDTYVFSWFNPQRCHFIYAGFPSFLITLLFLILIQIIKSNLKTNFLSIISKNIPTHKTSNRFKQSIYKHSLTVKYNSNYDCSAVEHLDCQLTYWKPL